MKKSIDARNLPCPKPVILTKHAVDSGDFEALEIIVDNAAAKENVKRFLTKQGYTQIDITQNGSDFVIQIGEATAEIESSQQMNQKTLFFASEFLGSGNDDLGKLLMRGYLYSLTELDTKPQRLIFMNSSVRLTVHGADTLQDLQKLEQSGVEILVCGTCLDFYHLKDQLAVGTISNMYTITESLMDAASTLKIS